MLLKISPDSVVDQKEKRSVWMQTRKALEENHYKHNRYGKRKKSLWHLFVYLLLFFKVPLKATRLYDIGNRNAKNIIVNRVEVKIPDLPESLDGYRILHLTDLHLDFITGIENRVCEKIKTLACDLCVLTGDYRAGTKGDFKHIMKPLQKIIDRVQTRDGVYAILGNHDTYAMAEGMERMGIRFLANETIVIPRGNDRIVLTGIDDPHYYYTGQAGLALQNEFEGFKVALVHTPELYDWAAENNYRLYLCGHTHGGQVCLPGGIPIVTHLDAGKRFYRGLWNYSDMTGYTNQGSGTVGIPIRFFTQSEIALITLKKGLSS